MKVLRNGRGLKIVKNPVLTLGNFDGIHIGHQRIIRKVAERAVEIGSPSAVYTFEPHPLKVVAPHKSPPLLLDMEDKKRLIASFGIDYLILARFTKEFASTHPGEFVEDVLHKKLSVREVWVGHDYAFGRGKTGTVEYLKELGRVFGFRVNVVPACKRGGLVVSSSRVRDLIARGDVKGAALLLGRPYSIKGRVVRGRDMGRSIGFPTANLDVASELVPARGVYAAYAKLGDRTFRAVVNIGTAPTFAKKGHKGETVEVHLLDFDGSIYGRRMEVFFINRLRDERPFGSAEELAINIQKDIKAAKRALRLGPDRLSKAVKRP